MNNTEDDNAGSLEREVMPSDENPYDSDDYQRYVAEQIPDVLFDGNAVWQSLDERAKTRTSAENVSDVLDAVVRLMRRTRAIQQPKSYETN